MRICVISSTVFPVPIHGYGGLEVVAWLTAKGLAEKGHQVAIVAPDGSSCPGVEIIQMGPARGVSEEQAYDRYWKRLLDFDCIIDNGWQKYSYFLKAEGRFKGPVLGVCHAPIDTMFSKPPPVDRPCIVCISQDQANHYESLFPRSIAKFVRNGVDSSFYHPVAAKRTRRFLFCARFSYIKGPALAIEACKKVGAELDLIGDTSITGEPEYLRQCQAMADGKQIRIVGPASRAACVWWMSQAHAFLHPNRDFREPFGLAPSCESPLCGLPVIAWNYGSLRETIENGKTGLLVRSEDELAQAIRTMLDNPFWSSQETRDYCRQWAKQFSVEAMVDGYERLCVEALETGGW